MWWPKITRLIGLSQHCIPKWIHRLQWPNVMATSTYWISSPCVFLSEVDLSQSKGTGGAGSSGTTGGMGSHLQCLSVHCTDELGESKGRGGPVPSLAVPSLGHLKPFRNIRSCVDLKKQEQEKRKPFDYQDEDKKPRLLFFYIEEG